MQAEGSLLLPAKRKFGSRAERLRDEKIKRKQVWLRVVRERDTRDGAAQPRRRGEGAC